MATGNQANSGGRGKGAAGKHTEEKGDKRRDNPPHSGPTRPGGSGRGKPGSDSNAESDK